MSKRRKLYNLRHRISVEVQRVNIVLKYLICFAEDEVDKNVLAEIALEKSMKISKMNEKIGIILKH